MRTHRTVPRRITNKKGVQTTVHVSPEGDRNPEVASKLMTSGVPSASSKEFPYPGADEPKEQVLGVFRMDDDTEEANMNHFFALCDVLYSHGADIPAKYQYSPGAHAQNARDVEDKSELDTFDDEWPDGEYHEMLVDGGVTTDTMLEATDSIYTHFIDENRDEQTYDFDGNLREDRYRRNLQELSADEVEESLVKLEAYGQKIPDFEKSGMISESRIEQHRENHKKQVELTKLELVRRIED